MRWDMGERTEDALVSYLKTKAGNDLRVSAAWERESTQFPAAIVKVVRTGPVSEDAEFHDSRLCQAEVAIITEGADKLDSSNAVLRTARERNRDATSQVMNALFIKPVYTAGVETDSLPLRLNAQGVAAVGFSMAQFATTEPIQDGRHLITIVAGEVIADPVEGT